MDTSSVIFYTNKIMSFKKKEKKIPSRVKSKYIHAGAAVVETDSSAY